MHPNKSNFIEGVDLIFKKWEAMRIALDMEWGGQESHLKCEDFKAGLVDYFDKGIVFFYVEI